MDNSAFNEANYLPQYPLQPDTGGIRDLVMAHTDPNTSNGELILDAFTAKLAGLLEEAGDVHTDTYGAANGYVVRAIPVSAVEKLIKELR